MTIRRTAGDEGTATPYLALAAHELRAPATVIVGAADTLVRTVDPEQLGPNGAELVDALSRNGRRLKRLVTDLLSDAYLERGELAMEPDLLPVLPVLGWAVRTAGASARLVDVTCDPLLHAFVDPDRLEQVIGNLVSNAVEHGRPPFVVEASAVARGERVAIVVRDHGSGVEPDLVPLLFQRFSPLAHRTANSTGLGLSIARDLARAMGGELTYQRAEPGSAFVVDLPGQEPR